MAWKTSPSRTGLAASAARACTAEVVVPAPSAEKTARRTARLPPCARSHERLHHALVLRAVREPDARRRGLVVADERLHRAKPRTASTRTRASAAAVRSRASRSPRAAMAAPRRARHPSRRARPCTPHGRPPRPSWRSSRSASRPRRSPLCDHGRTTCDLPGGGDDGDHPDSPVLASASTAGTCPTPGARAVIASASTARRDHVHVASAIAASCLASSACACGSPPAGPGRRRRRQLDERVERFDDLRLGAERREHASGDDGHARIAVHGAGR